MLWEVCAWLLGYAPLKVATRMGSAPMISCLRGRRVDWLHHRVFKIGGHGRTCISTDFSTSFRGSRVFWFRHTPGRLGASEKSCTSPSTLAGLRAVVTPH